MGGGSVSDVFKRSADPKNVAGAMLGVGPIVAHGIQEDIKGEKKEKKVAEEAAATKLQEEENRKKLRLDADRNRRMSIFQTGNIAGQEVGSVASRGTVFGN